VIYAPYFERYAEDFDADKGLGGVEIWIPIQVNGTREIES
jgi:predicted transcriptional regulator YdeE